MIDLHCHILPEIDDGPASMEDPLEIATTSVDNGISAIVATPHTTNGVYINEPEAINESVRACQQLLDEKRVALTLYPGAEVHVTPGLARKVEQGEVSTLNNTGRYILIEFPPQSVPSGVRDEIFNLNLLGITPIIAHPERNFALQEDLALLEELVRMGALAQITSFSILGVFGGYIKKISKRMLECRLVHIIASDAHSADYRAPELAGAVEAAARILQDFHEAEDMVTRLPEAILLGEEAAVPEPVLVKPKHWLFW